MILWPVRLRGLTIVRGTHSSFISEFGYWQKSHYPAKTNTKILFSSCLTQLFSIFRTIFRHYHLIMSGLGPISLAFCCLAFLRISGQNFIPMKAGSQIRTSLADTSGQNDQNAKKNLDKRFSFGIRPLTVLSGSWSL
jgi:hypothetical protein